MKLRLFLAFLALNISILNLFPQCEKAIEEFTNNPNFKHASVGFCIKDLNGNIIAAHNYEQAYTPASILKVITTASALELLGADYKYRTILLIEDCKTYNKIIIKGSGDPTLGTEFMNNDPRKFLVTWTEKIKNALQDKKQQEIEIYVEDDLFGYQGISPKWIYEDTGNYYASGAYGISVFDNTYRLSFNTEDLKKPPKIIGTSPNMKDIIFQNALTLNNTGKDNGYIVGAPFSNERSIIGNIPGGRKSFTIKGAIPNPGLYLGELISNNLKVRGFNVKRVRTSRDFHIESNEQEANLMTKNQAFHLHYSPSLKDIIRDINIRSNNHYSEHLIRTIGAKNRPNFNTPALDEGIKRVKEYWSKKGLNTDALFMYDGSGLAPSNAISSALMCDVLIYMQQKSKHAQAFLNSFPLAGQEGTVRNFLKGSRLQGKVYVKSGSIANTQCYAGYYIEGEKKYAFTIMVNQFNGTQRQAIQAIEKLLLNTLK